MKLVSIHTHICIYSTHTSQASAAQRAICRLLLVCNEVRGIESEHFET